MRHVTVLFGVAALLAATGCNNGTRFGGLIRSNPNPPASPGEIPTTAQLVDYLNRNGRLVQTMEVKQLDLDCKQKLQQGGLRGRMVCQKARNFRLAADLMGSQAVDIGSNDQEFWFWIGKSDPPYLFHCSYNDFARGGVRLPFPFRPEWVMEVLGMGEYGPPDSYQLVDRGKMLELVQQTKSQGQDVKKIIVFERNYAPVQVPNYILQDAQGKEICSAHITEVQQVNGATVPRRVKLVWPAEHIELKLKLDEVVLNRQLPAEQVSLLFTRPRLANVPSYDLARGPDAPPQGVRPAGGFR
jgi:hypothetical protein